jgi:DNA primase
MAKVSPVSIKYIIHIEFEADGAIEKPDIIGAIFGQTEGLLGDDLEMRELQKIGKIGRIDASLESENGKTRGEIEVPSAMDKTETALLAAALETIEKIGPSDTKLVVKEIEDVRENKRNYILERAKKLMQQLGNNGNGMDEITNEVKESVKSERITTYGTENLPCGDISGNELIIVEGRADVVNLLRKGVNNVIAMNGSKLPESIKELSRKKETTLFVDGDRGGNLIIKNVMENASINFVTMAPEGKEVEELTGKEIIQALRKRVPASEYEREQKNRGVRRYDRDYENRETDNRESRGRYEDETKDKYEEQPKKQERKIKKITDKEKEKIEEEINELIGSKGALIFNNNLEVVKKIPIGRLGFIRLDEEPYVIAIDGTATPRIIESCERLGCSNIIAKNFVDAETDINLISL